MLIPPDYHKQHTKMLRELSIIFTSFGKEHHWRPCQPYANEYAWALNTFFDHFKDSTTHRKLSVLEIGGAYGATLWYFAKRGISVTNVTHGHSKNPEVHERFEPLPYVEFIQGDFINLKPRKFDAVVAISSIEHNHPSKIWEIMQRIPLFLKPKGILIITIPVAEQGEWYPLGTTGLAPGSRVLFFDPFQVQTHMVPATKELKLMTPLETNAQWINDMRKARALIKRTKHAVYQPYLSGGLLFHRI